MHISMEIYKKYFEIKLEKYRVILNAAVKKETRV